MKTPTFTALTRNTEARQRRRTEGAHRSALRRDLDAFTTQADLHELAAILQRYDDTAVAPVRDAVDWTRAA